MNNSDIVNLPHSKTWVYNKYNNSFFPLKHGKLKVGDIAVSYNGRFHCSRLQRVTKVWYDEYKQMCWSSVDYYDIEDIDKEDANENSKES